MLEYTQLEPRPLWSVTQTVAVVSERVAGITPANPIEINPNYVGALFHIRMINVVNLTVGNIIVYGALHSVGAGAPYFFPAPASANPERLITNAVVLATGQGCLREPMATDNEAVATRQTLRLVPNALLLEYNTSAPGAGATATFEVWASFLGPMVGGFA